VQKDTRLQDYFEDERHCRKNCDISFTPGFSPVSNDDKKRGTVSTVFSLRITLRPLITSRLNQQPNSETVETVLKIVTRLSPG